MKIIRLFLFLLIFSTNSFGQHSITGKISDEEGSPLPFANITLHEKNNPENVRGVVSDFEGYFRFDAVQEGTYYLVISVLGFESKISDEFLLQEDRDFDFILQEDVRQLDEVVVKSKRPVIRQTAEKLVVDIENSTMINTTLQDVMRKVPGLMVTTNGISIAGNKGVRILINGKTTEYMDVQTLLRDFPADNIAKIEVIEQPGAEYEAAGTGAIIDIILKKNVRFGTHGNLNSWVGEDQGVEYGAGFSIASYKNKLNWQTGVSHSQPTWREDLFLVRTVGEETYDQTTKEPYDPNNFRWSGSVDYNISTKSVFGIGGQYFRRTSDRIASSTTLITQPNSTNVLFSENRLDLERYNFNLNPYYEFKTETDKLRLDLNYIQFKSENTNVLADLAESTLPFTNRKYQQDGSYSITTYRLDYTKTLSDEFSVSFGSRFADVSTDKDLQSFGENENEEFEFEEEESSQFLIEETIFALYTKANAKIEKWSFSGGLRYEDSNTNGNSIFMQNGSPRSTIQKRPIKKLFPSASISREITDIIGANVSYSYRIQRPSYSSLNTFAQFLDPYSASQGNPNLIPAFTNKFQFSLTYEGQPFFGIGYSTTKDAIFNIIQQDDTTAQIRQLEVNIENNSNWNFRLFGPLDFIPKVEGFTGFIVLNNDLESATYSIDLNKWSLIWFTQASYTLPYDINFEVSGNYGTGALDEGVDVDWFAELDFSFGKTFLDDRLKLNLGFNKMLNRGFVGVIDYDNVNASVESNGSRQNIQLRLSYSFGSKFGKNENDRDSSAEEERIQDRN